MNRRRCALAVLLALSLLLPVAGCKSDAERKQAHLERAKEYAAKGDAKSALIELRSALQLAPGDADVNFRIGELASLEGQAGDALFYYSEAARLDPKHRAARLGQAKLLFFQDPKRAGELIDSVLQEDPSDVLALVRASELELVRSDTAKSLAAAERAVELAPEDPLALAQLGMVRRAQIRERELRDQAPDEALFPAAIDAFDRALARADENTPLFDRLLLERSAVHASWPGHEAEAAKAYREAAERVASLEVDAKRRASVLLEVANHARRVSDPALERFALERLVEIRPEGYASWSRLAELEVSEGRSGVAVIQRLVEQRPADGRAHALYAHQLAEEGQRDDAIRHLDEVAPKLADKKDALAELAQILIAAGDLDRARAVVAELTDASNDPVIGFVSARLAVAEGKLAEAAQLLSQVTEQDAANVAAQRLLADVYMRLKRPEAALEALNKAISLRGAPAPIPWLQELARIQVAARDWRSAARTYALIVQRGGGLAEDDMPRLVRALYESGQPDQAREQLEQVLALPEPPLAAVLVFARREGRRDPERARALLADAVRRFPNSDAAMIQLVNLELGAGRRDEALRRIDERIETGAESASLRLLRARVLVAAGQRTEALADAERAVALNPAAPGAMDLLAALLHEAGRSDDAIAKLEELDRSGGLPVGQRVLLARLLMMRNDDERAMQLLEQSLAERSDLPGAKNDLAFLMAKHGRDPRRALDLAREALAARPEVPEFADTVGAVLLKLEMYEPAIDQLRSAVELADPASPLWASAQYRLGLALKGAGRKQEAARAFERSLAGAPGFPEAEEARQELRALSDASKTS